MGCLGEDSFGSFIESYLRQAKIDVRGLVRKKKVNTSATLVLVREFGERSFLHYLGANQEFSPRDINYQLIEECKIFHLGGAFLLPKLDGLPMAKVFKKIKRMKKIISLDTCWDAQNRWASLLKPCFEYLDLFLPSIEEAKKITGEARPEKISQILLDWGVKMVVLKMGGRGSYIRTSNKELYIPPWKVRSIDATGAGDSFIAGFLTGILKGWTLEETGRFANAVGAMCVQAIGATHGIKTLNQTLQFMKKTPLRK
jgi:sugar/nucleoside kinase (ribokinase family)